MAQYWKSKKDNALIKDRRVQLDNLLEFVNADLGQPERAAIQARIVDLLFDATTPGPGCKRILPVEKHRDLLPALQEHLGNHINRITSSSEMPVEMPFLIFNGSLELTLDRGGTRFYQRLRLLDVKEGDELNILKQALNLTLLQVIRDLDLRPKRFRKCQRCNAFFYQPTARKKDYCSTRCNDAVRLQRFRKQKSAASQEGGE
jgi:hypothetical protein